MLLRYVRCVHSLPFDESADSRADETRKLLCRERCFFFLLMRILALT